MNSITFNEFINNIDIYHYICFHFTPIDRLESIEKEGIIVHFQ